MIDIPQEMKTKLKQNRLDQYRATVYNLQLDLAAYEAVEDAEMAEHTKKNITKWEKAFKAVEEMV